MKQQPSTAPVRPELSQKGRPKCVGYARVSTDDQTTQLQRDALLSAGCETVFEDDASGVRRDRAELFAALQALTAGDTLVVWKLDRLGRSLGHLVAIADDLRDRGIFLKSLTEAIDTATASGRLLYGVLGAVAAFERDVIVERTRAGMRAARNRGVSLGRRKALRPSQLVEARRMLDREDDPKSVSEVARIFKVGRATLYRSLAVG
jgi:DNA invertase Pin-like site-specific DNA recombinase